MYDTEYELGTPIPDRSCGNCTLCCKVNGVPELEKPVGEWCKHCEVGKGCKIYADRPEVCAKWYCGWRTVPFLGDVWYPASARMVANVIRKENHLLMVFCVDRGMRNRWKEPPWNERLRRLARVGMEKSVPVFVIHVDDGQRWIMLPNGPVKWAPHTVPLPMGENKEGVIWKLVSFPSREAAHQAVEQWGRKPGSPRVRAVLQNWAMINSIEQGETLER
jgi:hypothetical protein